MKFSVLIPVYNAEKYIDECLTSILGQTYTDFEVVLVDDGSTDSSGEICDRYALKDERVRVIHKKNGGSLSSRCVAISEAEGDYCIFVDADDFISRKLLEVVSGLLADDVDMVIYNYRYYCNGKFKERNKHIFNDGEVFCGENKKVLYDNIINTIDIAPIWMKAIKTEILKSDKTDYSVFYKHNMGEDVFQFLYPLTYSKKIVYTSEALVNYRYDNESVSRTVNIASPEKETVLYLYKAYKNYLKIWNMPDIHKYEEQIDAKEIYHALYVFRKLYMQAKTSAEKKRLLTYDWKSFAEDDVHNEYSNNNYLSPESKRLWGYIDSGKTFRIKIYFFFKKAEQRIKKAKRKLKGH